LTSCWRRAGADWRGILRPALTPSQVTPNLTSIPRLTLRVNQGGRADSARSTMALRRSVRLVRSGRIQMLPCTHANERRQRHRCLPEICAHCAATLHRPGAQPPTRRALPPPMAHRPDVTAPPARPESREPPRPAPPAGRLHPSGRPSARP